MLHILSLCLVYAMKDFPYNFQSNIFPDNKNIFHERSNNISLFRLSCFYILLLRWKRNNILGNSIKKCNSYLSSFLRHSKAWKWCLMLSLKYACVLEIKSIKILLKFLGSKNIHSCYIVDNIFWWILKKVCVRNFNFTHFDGK